MNTRLLLLLGLLIVGLGCVAQTEPPTQNGNPTPSPGGGNIVEVSMKNIQFNPSAITVNVGDTIRFTNNDGFAHDIYIHQGSTEYFTDAQTEAGEVVEVKMTQAGTFALDCVRHGPGMAGTIQVN